MYQISALLELAVSLFNASASSKFWSPACPHPTAHPLDIVSYTFTLKQLGEAKCQTKSATGCRHHSPIPGEPCALPSARNYAVLVPWCHPDWCSSARSVSVSIDHVLVLDKVAGHQSTFGT